MTPGRGPDRRGPGPEVRWRQVLEVASEAYVAVDEQARVVDWNDRACELFDWRDVDPRGVAAHDLLVPAQRASFERGFAALLDADRLDVARPRPLLARTASGREFAAEAVVWGVDRRGGVVVHCFVRDVTERARVEEATARLAAVVEGSSDAIITESLDGTILSWNAAAERMYGWRSKEAVGQPVTLLVPPAQRRETSDARQRVAHGETVAGYESERLTRGGTRLPVAVRLSPVHDRAGEVTAVSEVTRDVTEQRWMAETLDRTLAQLQQAADEARTAEEAARRFLADAAHQLRSPVAGIQACAETLLRAGSDEARDQLLATVVRETSRAARLVTGLLQMARLDQGLKSELQDVDVVQVCRNEAERLSLLAPHLQVGVEVVGQAPEPLLLDPVLCRDALANLGDNAARHARTCVRLHVRSGRDGVQIDVRDDGAGVARGLRDVVFDRFTSLDGRGGAGLGLAIARSAARSLGGDLLCDGGFVLVLPRR